ncbi:MAG: Spy/CpxP family protein refolding chaperone [Acidobacteria bacterium]|nr:Spy/CpxP family protein refolding chaperone [Acidobacteriota bacterium]
MSLRNRLTGAMLSIGLLAAFGISAFAQTEGMGKEGGQRHNRVPVLRIMRDLNLTDAQQKQADAIIEKFKTSTEPQRQALADLYLERQQGAITDDMKAKAQGLRAQIDAARQSMTTELMALLTPEQRTQYEQLEKQWRERRDQMRSRRRARGDTQTDEL